MVSRLIEMKILVVRETGREGEDKVQREGERERQTEREREKERKREREN